jgi:orotidine 5'-phosphate decarboxylase subfamily 2
LATSYVERLARRCREAGSFVCVGLDAPGDLPAEEVAVRNRALIEATAPYAACFKPNLAFYEQFGIPGLRALEATIDAIPDGIPVIGDAKRGDMGNTAAAYARALFDVWGFDAATVNPFQGRDAVEPFLAHEDRGIYVLCRTSNPGSAAIQNATLASGEFLYERLAAEMPSWGANVGLVVGATAPAELARVRALAPRTALLVPGVGAQGGAPADVVAAAGGEPGLLVVNASRSIANARDPAAAARDLRDALNAALP